MQTRRWVGTCAMSIAIGAASMAMAAQDARGTAPDKRGTSSQVTLSGCLEEPVDPNDGYAASAVEGPFRLSNVTMTPRAAQGRVYLLDGDRKQFAAHVGRQVEIVGTMVDPRQATRDTMSAYPTGDQYTASAVTGTTGTKPPVGGEPTVRVQSVRRMADKCSARK